MATMPSLQQALKSLCSKTGWCYAVFWKLKRRSRMMLTWEDGYCDYSRSSADVCNTSNVLVDTGGNPLDQGGSGDKEGQIGLAVARMSYYVYSMGEGIIGRVAFTGKFQWVFHDVENGSETDSGGKLNKHSASEKNPDGWQNQFAAGIKTIAVIAVPQGVVQLGSTQLMKEDLKWIDHVKSVFSALQTAPMTPKSELVLEGQGARSLYTNKPPFFSGSNTATLTRKPITGQHNQFLPRNAEDTVHWQNVGAQASPVSVPKLLGLQSIGGPLSAAGAVGRERQVQQAAAKVLAEPQCVKYSSAILGPQTTQMHVNVPQSVLPSSDAINILPYDSIKCRSLDDTRAGNLNNDSTWASLVAEGISTGLHNNLKRDHVSTCGESLVKKFCRGVEEDYSVKKTFGMCSKPETIKQEGLSSGSLSARHHHHHYQQQQQQQQEGFSSGSLSAVHHHHHPQQQQIFSPTNNTALKSADLSAIPGRVIGKECFDNKVYSAAVDVTSQFPAKSFVAPSPAHGNIFGREVLSNHESHCSDRGPNLHNNGGQSDVSTFNELEKFLASFCKEETGNWDSSFAIGDELSQALGPTFWKGGVDDVQNSSRGQNSEERVFNQAEKAPSLPMEVVADWGSKNVKQLSYERLAAVSPLEDKPEPLLDAIVGSASNNRSSNTEASFSVQDPFSNLTCGAPALSITYEKEPVCSSSFSGKLIQTAPHHGINYHDTPAGMLRNLQSHFNFGVASDTQTNLSVHSWTDEGQSFMSDDTQRVHSQSKSSGELSKSSKKRSRSGESARPRPKDRQQIQDRVRELRDIVPNGSKCSIDALLEKTIKHMLFLHNVTLHADQLKNTGELKEDPENGATWALDLGSQEKRYPIVVKDLNQPRRMLVEMMCEESGLFLETADIIRNLGLTILRGSMESHGEKFWARFIVEANRDIQRVDVLVSLIQRLHLDSNSSSSSMTMASQSTAVKPQHGVDSNNSYAVSGKK